VPVVAFISLNGGAEPLVPPLPVTDLLCDATNPKPCVMRQKLLDSFRAKANKELSTI